MLLGDSEIGLQTCLGQLRHTGLPGYGFGRSLRRKAWIHRTPFKAKRNSEEADHLGRLFSYQQAGGDSMAQDFSRAFYNSAAWKACRESYKRSKGGLCEDCLKQGRITAGAEVHHIKALTPDNIGNPNITLNWDNLCLLCKDCHAKRHMVRRYRIDKVTGAVIFS